MAFYEVKVVDQEGNVFAEFGDDATVLEVTWVLNEPGMVRFAVPVHHPDAGEVHALTREVQVWRNGAIIFWGVPVQADLQGGAMVWYCPGLLWYFTRRYFGPITINYLSNPNFESDLTGWSASGPTASHSTAIRLRGPGTAKLVENTSGDNFLRQTVSVDTGPIGLFLAVAAWYWIDPADPITEPALEERGLYVEAANSAQVTAWEPITMNAEVGKPQRVETGIHLDPNLTDEPVDVRLYAPKGTIHWGATSVTEEESVSSEPEGTDIATMLGAIVGYAQTGLGKSDLNIGTSTPLAGVKEITAYQFKDLGNIFDALQTYPARGLADFEVVITDTTRTFTTYAPRKTSVAPTGVVQVPNSGVLTLGFRTDGQQTSSKAIVRGAGDGSDRELGVATDTAPLDGLVLETVTDAPPEITVDGLTTYASTALDRVSAVVTVPAAQVESAGWVGAVEVGDKVTVVLDWGAVQESSVRRLVSMSVDPVADTVSLGLAVNA